MEGALIVNVGELGGRCGGSVECRAWGPQQSCEFFWGLSLNPTLVTSDFAVDRLLID